MTIRYIYN